MISFLKYTIFREQLHFLQQGFDQKLFGGVWLLNRKVNSLRVFFGIVALWKNQNVMLEMMSVGIQLPVSSSILPASLLLPGFHSTAFYVKWTFRRNNHGFSAFMFCNGVIAEIGINNFRSWFSNTNFSKTSKLVVNQELNRHFSNCGGLINSKIMALHSWLCKKAWKWWYFRYVPIFSFIFLLNFVLEFLYQHNNRRLSICRMVFKLNMLLCISNRVFIIGPECENVR